MSTRKVGVEFYVAGAANVARDVNKIAGTLGSAAKFGLKFAGINMTAMYVGRAVKNFYADAISNSKEATRQIDAMNSSWAETKRLIGSGLGNAMAPLYRDVDKVLGRINTTIRSATELQSLFDKLSASEQATVQAEYERQTGGKFGYYNVKTATAGAFSLAGSYSASNQTTRQYTGPNDQILAYHLTQQHLSVDEINGVTQAQQDARNQVDRLNMALGEQMLILEKTSQGHKHAAEKVKFQSVVEAAYAKDTAKQNTEIKKYERNLYIVDLMQQKIKDAETAQKARQDVAKMNDELDREFAIIGRLNDSHERAAKAIAYESAVRQGYAGSIETQNRMLAEYEKKLRDLERHEQLVNTAQQFGDAWGNAFEEFAMDTSNAREAVRGLITDIQRMVIRQTISQPIANSMSQAFMAAFSGGGGKINAATPGAGGVHGFHGGGVPLYDRPSFTRFVHPGLFAGAPRAHSGIGPGEMPAIIRKDEGVFTPGQMRALGRGMVSSEERSPVTIQFVDQSTGGVEVAQANMRREAGKVYVEMIAKDRLRKGPWTRRT